MARMHRGNWQIIDGIQGFLYWNINKHVINKIKVIMKTKQKKW